MGKQIGVCMSYADEQSFIAALQAKADVVVALIHFATAEPEFLDPLPPPDREIGDNTSLAIFNRDIDPKLVTYKVANREGYSLDLTRSEVIQFNRCFRRTAGKHEPGRLWWDHETMRGKPKRKAFLAWAQFVSRVVKKNHHDSKTHYCYFGPEAWTEFEAGELTLAS